VLLAKATVVAAFAGVVLVAGVAALAGVEAAGFLVGVAAFGAVLVWAIKAVANRKLKENSKYFFMFVV
jgi:4-hydroxybenzoate polyprenyltransferase